MKLWVTGERAKTFLNLRICFLSYFYPISEPENLFLILWCILSQPVALTNSGLEGARKFEHKQCSGVWGKVVWKYKQFLNRQPWYVWQVGGGGLNMWFCKIPLFSYLFPHRVAKLHKIKNILNDACRSMGKVSRTFKLLFWCFGFGSTVVNVVVLEQLSFICHWLCPCRMTVNVIVAMPATW